MVVNSESVAIEVAKAYAAEHLQMAKSVVSVRFGQSLSPERGDCWSVEFEIDWGGERCDPETMYVEIDALSGVIHVPDID